MSTSTLLSTFANNILPIILLGGAGYALGKLLQIDPRSLGRVVFYVFSPVLIFDILIKNQLEWSEAATVIGFTVLVVTIMGLLAYLLGTFFKLERTALIAVIVTVMFANTGNYGLPLVSFAFGEKALSYASVYFITTTFMFYTVGVVIASLGRMSFKEAALSLLKLPTLWAVLLAIVIITFDITIPMPIDRAVTLASGGTIPLMLVLLGVQMTDVEFTNNVRAMQISVVLRLIIAPIIAMALTMLMGMHGAAKQAGITQASMPTMVSTTVLASEYNLDSKLIAAIVFVSTLLSPLTLTPLLVFLGR